MCGGWVAWGAEESDEEILNCRSGCLGRVGLRGSAVVGGEVSWTGGVGFVVVERGVVVVRTLVCFAFTVGLLSSNGVAQINEQTIQALRDLHPPLTADLQLPTTDVTQLKVDLSFVINKLFKDSTDANISNDVYGWSAALFHHVRGQRGGFLETLAEFICLIAN